MPATLNAGVFNVEIKDETEVDNKKQQSAPESAASLLQSADRNPNDQCPGCFDKGCPPRSGLTAVPYSYVKFPFPNRVQRGF